MQDTPLPSFRDAFLKSSRPLVLSPEDLLGPNAAGLPTDRTPGEACWVRARRFLSLSSCPPRVLGNSISRARRHYRQLFVSWLYCALKRDFISHPSNFPGQLAHQQLKQYTIQNSSRVPRVRAGCKPFLSQSIIASPVGESKAEALPSLQGLAKTARERSLLHSKLRRLAKRSARPPV